MAAEEMHVIVVFRTEMQSRCTLFRATPITLAWEHERPVRVDEPFCVP